MIPPPTDPSVFGRPPLRSSRRRPRHTVDSSLPGKINPRVAPRRLIHPLVPLNQRSRSSLMASHRPNNPSALDPVSIHLALSCSTSLEASGPPALAAPRGPASSP